MIFFQVVIGGITRLTGSGLSITKWEIVTGLNLHEFVAMSVLYLNQPCKSYPESHDIVTFVGWLRTKMSQAFL